MKLNALTGRSTFRGQKILQAWFGPTPSDRIDLNYFVIVVQKAIKRNKNI